MEYFFGLLGLYICLLWYLLFYRTELLRSKLIKVFNHFKVEEESGHANFSQYLSTNDGSPIIVLRKENTVIILLSCGTHGQLKNIYLLCLIIDDRHNSQGIYGDGRVPRVCKRAELDIAINKKSKYENKGVDKLLISRAQAIEVNNDKAFLFYPISSVFGSEDINIVAKSIA